MISRDSARRILRARLLSFGRLFAALEEIRLIYPNDTVSFVEISWSQLDIGSGCHNRPKVAGRNNNKNAFEKSRVRRTKIVMSL